MDVLPPVELHISSPSNRLHSPEPSGTPDMRRVSSHRGTPSFGYGYGSVSGDSDSKCMDTTGKSMVRSIDGKKLMQIGFHDYACSISDIESKATNLGDIYLSDSNFEGDFKKDGSNHISGDKDLHFESSQFYLNDILQDFRVENANEPVSFARADLEINIGSENHGKMPIAQNDGHLDVDAIETSRLQHVESLSQSHVHKCQCSVSNDALLHCLQKEEIPAKTDAKFLDLVQKVTSLHLNQSMNLSNSAVIPVNGNRTTNTISELQKRISDLKVQVTKERSLKHAVAQQLGTFRQESAKMLQQKQKIWESKFRELQKEKHGLSAQLQKLNMENPRHLLARGEEVSLTKEDLKRLRQEIEEQESLIKGYQMENEKALEKLREVQLSAKEKEKKMTEEIVAISDQLACLQASATSKPSKEDTYASLSESLTLRGEILDVQAREEALITELDTVKKEKKYLEKKILDLEETLKIQIKSGVENCVPMLDASCECVLITNYTNNDGSGMFGHSEDLETNVVPDDTWERKLENHENKNLLNYENILKASLGEGQKKIQNLQKRMEKMKRDYELRIRELKNQILKKSVKNVEHGNSRRVKDLEAQITQVRSFYMKKVKDLNDKLNAKQSLLEQIKTGRLKSDPTSKRIAGPSSQNLHEKIALLENIIAEKDAAIKNLEDKNLNTKRDDNVCQLEVEGKLTAKTKEEITENSCNGTVTENSKESKDLEDYLHAMYEKGEEGGGQELISFNQALSRVCENCAKTFSFSGGKQEQHLKLTMSSAPCGSGVNIANRSKHTGHEKVFYPRQQGVTCNSKLDVEMQPMDPSQQLQILKRKVLEMEERQNQRECEWQRILIDTKRLLSLEHDMTERKWELAMEVKNSEIERFKLELEAILEAAIKLQKAQLKPSLPNISSYDLR